MSGYSNPLGASILIALGMIFVVLGIDGTARVRIEGLGDATLVISGVDGINDCCWRSILVATFFIEFFKLSS